MEKLSRKCRELSRKHEFCRVNGAYCRVFFRFD